MCVCMMRGGEARQRHPHHEDMDNMMFDMESAE